MRRKVVIHPGFHKTGTTTAQRVLYENRELVWRSHAIGMRWRFPDLIHAARGYSTWRDPDTLTKFALRFAGFIAGLDMPAGRGLVVSAEELGGHLPGREKVPDYGALPELMAEATRVLEAAFPGELDLSFLITTRDPAPWLDSAWAEHVKASRMKLDLADFRARFAPAADLGGMVERLCDAVSPWPVVRARLEDIAGLPLGPGQPLIDLMGLPEARRAKLRPVSTHNARLAPEVLDEMLALNRSDLDPDTLMAAKKAILTARHSR